MRASDGVTVALAISEASVDSAVGQLITIELAVGAAVMVVLAVVGAVVVRRSLLQLQQMEAVADAIAAGDLERRIPQADPRSETGRLGVALNAMVGRLLEALRQREASEQRLRRFVDDASHELRTPLTSVQGFAELYRRYGATDEAEVREWMGRIESEARRMGGLVDDLLELATLDRTRALDTAEVDLAAIARDVVRDSLARNPARTVTVDAPDEPVLVRADEDRLRQVITNLANNALVHGDGGAPIVVRVRRGGPSEAPVAAVGVDTDGARTAAVTSVAVIDHGPGIPPADAERIFDRFYRVEAGRTGRGTGLGLAIAAAIADAHGGRIELHRNEFGGSTFVLLLPDPGCRSAR
ncbi:sensor histidine kinase [Tsukamurella soli]|uniref:sensor histidine kinase n=1 Tax=Tsukamurella soli TaxID=644556 RepID=UPI00360BD31F